jgi:YidC/Oxa1 family membrane protein insertase
MDRNQIIGIILIFTLFIVWQQFFAPTPEELQAEQARRDSIAQIQQAAETPPAADLSPQQDSLPLTEDPVSELTPDSILLLQRSGSYGAFAPSTLGEPTEQILENDLMRVTINTKGGLITEVLLKEHYKVVLDSNFKEQKVPLTLLDDPKNKFEYLLPVSGVPNGVVRTSELIFTPTLEANILRLRANAGPEQYVEQVYTIQDDSYLLDYDLNLVGLQEILANDAQQIELDWVNFLDKIEINENYERNYTSIYFKPAEDAVDRCSCTSSDEESSGQPVKWVAAANQFFTSAIFADNRFERRRRCVPKCSTRMRGTLKKGGSPISSCRTGIAPARPIAMQLYVGPNEFDRMRAIGHDFTDVIPYGRSIFGAINRWVIRPIFNFFDGITGNKGHRDYPVDLAGEASGIPADL